MCAPLSWPCVNSATIYTDYLLHVLFILLGVVFPGVLFVTGNARRKQERNIRWTQRMKTHLYYGNGGLLFGMAGLVLLVWYLSGRPFAELGLSWGRMPYDSYAVVALFVFVSLYLLDVYRESASEARRAAARESFKQMGFMPATATQFLNFIFLAVAAGVGEEIVFRGFMITYLQDLFGTESYLAVGAALLVPALAFALGHIYQGWKAVLKIVGMALLFGFFYLRTGTLWPLMLLHTAIDVFGGMMSWWLLAKR